MLINCDSRMALGEAALSDEANCLYKCVFGEGAEGGAEDASVRLGE